MVFAGLIVSVIVLGITWLVVTFSEVAGFSITTLLGLPFFLVYDFVRRKIKYPGKTKEEVEAIELERYKAEHYNEKLDIWI